jgi:hypothetical protein
MYSCNNNVLALLPAQDTPFTLTVDNPGLAIIHGKPVTAGGLHWSLGGETSSYCPSQVGDACPPGDTTVIAAFGGSASMSVMVPEASRPI